MPKGTKGTGILRERNKRKVLSLIRQFGETSRQDLTEHMNVSKNTISLIIEEFLTSQIVKEVGYKEPGAMGRPKILIQINKDGYKSVGFSINKKAIEYTVINYCGEVLEKKVITFDCTDPVKLKEKLFSTIQEITTTYDGILGVGIGIPGIIDVEKKYVYSSTHLGWKNISLKDECEAFDIEIIVQNSVNMGALSAIENRGLKSNGISFFVHVGEGVGGAYIIDDFILNGGSWTAGEIGHISIDPLGEICGCGQRGCLEQLINVSSYRNRMKKIVNKKNDLYQMKEFKDIMAEFGSYLGKALVSVVHLMNPNKIYIDTPYNSYNNFVSECLSFLETNALEIPYKKTKVIFGENEYSMSKGAALSVILNYERIDI